MSNQEIKRVGIIFSGGPAPAANAVTSAAAVSFLEDGKRSLGSSTDIRILWTMIRFQILYAPMNTIEFSMRRMFEVFVMSVASASVQLGQIQVRALPALRTLMMKPRRNVCGVFIRL